MRPYTITTPIYYVNDLPHIGHAYCTIAADAAARYHRMAGNDVFFLTGTDEHGINIERAARAAGVPMQAWCDRVSGAFRSLWKVLDISNDDFLRTSDRARHYPGVQKIWKAIAESGDLYLSDYEGLYCPSCEAFYPEAQSEGGRCPVHERTLDTVREPTYFFRLSGYQERLLAHYRANPSFIEPESRRNEVIAFVESGLRDLSVSRSSVEWGIPVPGDPDHVVYVWMDALSNYITALGYGASEPGRFRTHWPADVHLIGKEIIRFHAVYWPAFLMSAGLPLPRQVFAHGWLLINEKKMSKSLGNRVDPIPLVEVLGTDAVRYYLLRETSFGLDGSYSDEALVDRVNADLANDLGNLLSRVTKLVEDNFSSTIPVAAPGERPLSTAARETIVRYREAMDALRFHEALSTVWAYVSAVNGYIVRTEPWKLAKAADSRPELASVLYDSTEALRVIALLIGPVMPATARRIYGTLGLPRDPLEERWDEFRWGGLAPGTRLGARLALFPRLDKAQTLNEFGRRRETPMTETPQAPKPTEPATPSGPTQISMADFQKVDLRAAQVVSCERIPGADKLFKLVVDIGTEKRQMVAGIAPWYQPEALVGKLIVVVTNLKPVTLRGVNSEAMLLAADAGTQVVVATLDGDIRPGTPVH